MASIKAGTTVEILISGVWEGPFTVESGAGRAADHNEWEDICECGEPATTMNAYDAVVAVHTPAHEASEFEAIAAIARELGVAYEYAVNVYAHRMAADLPTVKREVPAYDASVSFI